MPLNWEHPDAHAIFWAVKGLKVASKENYTFDELNTDRIVQHSLQKLFRYGKIIIYPVPIEQPADAKFQDEKSQSPLYANMVFVHPDLRMFEPFNKLTLELIDKYERLQGNVLGLKSGHRNMLKTAVSMFYQAGHTAYAQKIYDQLRELYPKDEFKLPLQIFVRNEITEDLRSLEIKGATEIIQTVLREAYYRYALHEDNEAFGREKMAREIYDNYQKDYGQGRSAVRLSMPDFKVLRYLALDGFLRDEMYPPNMRNNLLARIKNERPQLFEQLQAQHESLIEKAAEK